MAGGPLSDLGIRSPRYRCFRRSPAVIDSYQCGYVRATCDPGHGYGPHVAVVPPSDDSDRPDIPALLAPGLRAALRALDAKLAQDSKQRGELVRDALRRRTPQLQETLARAQMPIEPASRPQSIASRMQATVTRVQRMIERDMPQIQAAMRAAAERAHHEQLGKAGAGLRGVQAVARGRTDADVDAIAAVIERNGNPRGLIADLTRAVARATLALERVPAGADNTLTWRDMVALLSLLLGMLTVIGVDVDLTPDATSPMIIELSDPVIGSIERYVDGRAHDLLEEDGSAPEALVRMPEQSPPTP